MKRVIAAFTLMLTTLTLVGQEFHQAQTPTLNTKVEGNHINEAGKSNAYLKSAGEGYAVGSIPAQFDVSPSGAATYTVPIEVPPGVGGMQPGIALSYNSQAGGGIAGWGWTISGLSSISRVPKTVYHDGKVEGIKWTKDDALSLDGQRLIAISNSGNLREYRTEADNGSKIVGYDIKDMGPTYFNVYTKNGLVMRYEAEFMTCSDLREEVKAIAVYVPRFPGDIYDDENWKEIRTETVSRKNTALACKNWVLKRVSDRNGNYVLYNYDSQPTEKSVIRKTISSPYEYSDSYPYDYFAKSTRSKERYRAYSFVRDIRQSGLSNERLRSVTYGNQNRELGKIQFHYTARLQKIAGYIAGYKQEQALRLDRIEVVSTAEDNVRLKTYQLKYKSGEDKLSSVGLEGMENERLKETAFEWAPNRYNFVVTGEPVFYETPKYNAIRTSTYNDSFEYDIVATGDLDGDGVLELAVKMRFGNKYWVSGFPKGHHEWEYQYLWALYRSNGSSSTYSYMYEFDWNPQARGIVDITNFYFLDTDNDGKDEFYCCLDDRSTSSSSTPGVSIGGYIKGYRLRNGIVESVRVNPNLSSAASRGGGGINSNTSHLIPGNFVGDGIIRFAQIDADNNFIGLTDITNPPTKTIISGGDYHRYYLTDINGNGKSELMYVGNGGVYFYECSSISSQGCHFTQIAKITSSAGVGYPRHLSTIKLGDFNGDGLTDILVNTNIYGYSLDAYYMWLSRGNGSFERMDLPNGFGLFDSSVRGDPPMVMDVNADGFSDIVMQIFKQINGAFKHKLTYLIGNGKGSFSHVYSKDLAHSLGIFRSSGKYYNHLSTCIRTSMDELLVLNKGVIFNKINKIDLPYGNDALITYAQQAKSISVNVEPINLCAELDGEYNSCVLPDFIVVDKVNSGDEMVNYGFNHPQVNRQGKGFLGFAETTVHNAKSNTTSISQSELNSTFQTLLPKTRTVKKGNTTFSTSVQNIRLKPLGGKRYRAEVNYTTEKNHLNKTGTKTTYQSYDAWGNPTKIKEEYYDGDNIIPNTYRQTEIAYTHEGSYGCDYLPRSIIQSQRKDAQAENHEKTYRYNSQGKVIEQRTDPGTSYEVKTTYANYDTYGNARSVKTTTPNDGVSGNDHTLTMTYTKDGRFPASKTTGNMTTHYQHDLSKAQLRAETAPSGLATHYFYNGLGQKYKTQSPSGVESYTTLNWAEGDADAPTGALYYSLSKTSGIAETRTYYNAQGQELRTLSYGFNGKKIYADKEYDSKDRLKRASQPYFKGSSSKQWTTYAYDAYDRLRDITEPDGTLSQTLYDDAHRKVRTKITKNGLSQQSKKYSNALGQLTISEDNMGNKVHYKYDAAGRLKESWVNDLTQHKTTFIYDGQGNRIRLSDPDAGTIKNTYDALGQTLTHTNARGQYSTFTYDNLGRILNKSTRKSVNGGTIETLRYNYFSSGAAIGQLNSITQNGLLKERYTYDKLGRMNSKSEYIDGQSFTHSHTYDDYGRIATQTYPGGYTIRHKYNQYGDLWQISEEGRVIYENKAFTAQEQLTRYHLPGARLSVDRLFDNKGRLMSDQTNVDDVGMLYAYDAMGNVSERIELAYNRQELFSYDRLNRLTKAECIAHFSDVEYTQNISYDATGNILSKTGIGANMVYGASGKPHALASINTPTGYRPPEQNISYTHFNKTKKITQDNYTYEYTYGADRQRRKTVFKEGDKTRRTKYYIGNYEKVITPGSTKEYHYLYADAGLFAIFVKENGSGRLCYTRTDHLGSLKTVLDVSRQRMYNYSYDAWGKPRDPYYPTQAFGGLLFAERGFGGHEHLPRVFGLIDMNGRMYDPELGRFLSPDPYVQAPDFSQNFNRYSYCLNNPLRYVDPSGEFVHLVVGAIVGGAMNLIFNAGKIDNFWDGLGYFGVGAAAGALGAMTGGATMSLTKGMGVVGAWSSATINVAATGFVQGAAVGAASGFFGGFGTGFGNSMLQDNSLNSALGNGLRSGGIGGLTGGVLGGVGGGINAMKQDLRFWDGALVQDNILIDKRIPYVQQIGDYNCGPANCEAISQSRGGNVTQQSVRDGIGGNPNVDAVRSNTLINEFNSQSGIKINLAKGGISAQETYNYMSSGYDIGFGRRLVDVNIGHLVTANRITERTVTKLSGKVTKRLLIDVMDPARGQYIRVSQSTLKNAYVTFLYFP